MAYDWNSANADYRLVALLHELEQVIDYKRGTNEFNATSIFGKSDKGKAWDNDSAIWTNCLGKDIPYSRP